MNRTAISGLHYHIRNIVCGEQGNIGGGGEAVFEEVTAL